MTPEDWLEVADLQEGSWWPSWTRWLSEQSSGRQNPPELKTVLNEAPGTYVLME
ncbi:MULTISPECIES: hypothetical protein [unclassified Ruegeria]|uniref:hypothetical protein n=1 Tax=unclassified Ruegeria TaxID=2625375 RepID=UPI001487BF79|nr:MULTISPECIES: hypothetical protein [unclassified Ruegeria]